MLASPVSDDIFLFIAAEAASEAESAATGETTDVVPGGEAAPLPAAAALQRDPLGGDRQRPHAASGRGDAAAAAAAARGGERGLPHAAGLQLRGREQRRVALALHRLVLLLLVVVFGRLGGRADPLLPRENAGRRRTS